MEAQGFESHPFNQFTAKYGRQYAQRLQYYLDKSAPHVLYRWLALAAAVAIYTLRVFALRGFYIITYGLGIYNLNLLLGFLTPQADPELDGPELPTKDSQEFRPFVRRLPEFKFWYSAIKSVLIGLFLTFFKMFDIPVFWPILLLYFFVLFFVTMKRQIMHMIKYKYIPFSLGKKRYSGGGRSSERRKDDKEEAEVTKATSAQTIPQSNAAINMNPANFYNNNSNIGHDNTNVSGMHAQPVHQVTRPSITENKPDSAGPALQHRPFVIYNNTAPATAAVPMINQEQQALYQVQYATVANELNQPNMPPSHAGGLQQQSQLPQDLQGYRAI